MRPRRPTGFAVLATFAVAFAIVAMYGIFLGSREPLIDGVLLVWSGLALVTAEALWRVRPWVPGATLALQVAVVGALAAGALAVGITGGWEDGRVLGMIAAGSALGLEGMVRYVRRQIRGPGANRVAIPVPGPKQP